MPSGFISFKKGVITMKFVNVQELKNKTSEIIKMSQENDIIVISRSKPVAIIRHFNEDELEDYVLMNHPDFLAQMEKAFQEMEAEKATDIDEYIASLKVEEESKDAI
jgi:hypothetical protein